MWRVTILAAIAVSGAQQLPDPEPVRDPGWRAAFDRQRRELRVAPGPVDACFVGDSLTQFWADHGRHTWNGAAGYEKLATVIEPELRRWLAF